MKKIEPSGKIIWDKLLGLESNDIVILNDNVQSYDFIFKRIVDVISEKKPKEIIINYPTECDVKWLHDSFYPIPLSVLNDVSVNLKEYQFTITKEFLDLEKILVENDVKCYLILGSDKPDHLKYFYNESTKIKNFEILFWPTYLIWHTYNGLRDLLYPQIKDIYSNVIDYKIDKKFDNLFINYNNKPRLHRCMFLDELYIREFFKYGRISWNKLTTSDPYIVSDISGVYNYTFKNWKEEILNIDGYSDVENKVFCDEYSSNLIHSNALIEVVSETSKEVTFITEKTFRPIFLEQPFICLGAINQNTDLIKYGFELYDEIFDYSFDTNPDLNVRINGVIENLNKIKDSNYYEIYNLLEPKIKRNKDRIFEILENDTFNPYIPFYNKYIKN